MANLKNFFRYFVIFLIVFGTFPYKSIASESAEFTINPIYGKGQTDDTLGYFSIKYGDEESYPVKIKIKNLNSEKTSSFEVRVVSATTTDNGMIDYTPSEKEKVDSNIPMMEDFVSEDQLTQVVILRPNEEKEVSIDLKKPVDSFEGTVLGSIYVKKKQDISETENKNGIKNVFAMTIPIIISQDFEKKIIPNLSLSDINVITEMGETKVTGDISNTSPVMFGEILVRSWITKKGSEDVLYEATSKNFEMAPNSKFSHAIDIKNEIFKPGEYTYHTILTSGKQKYEMSENFTIKSNTPVKNSVVLEEEEKETLSTVWIAVIMILSIFVIVAITYKILVNKKMIKPWKRSRKKR